MPTRRAKPDNMPRLSPYLTVRDVDKALDFYERAFGFARGLTVPGSDGRTAHAEASFLEAKIMLGPENVHGNPSKAPASSGVEPAVGLYIYCDDVDGLFERATAAGAKADFPPQTMFWGDRICNLRDPDGHSWTFATNLADFDPSKAPG